MSGEGKADAPPVQSILSRARTAAFFALVEQLEGRLGGPAVGEANASEEPIRFRHHPGLEFSAGDVESARAVRHPPDGRSPERAHVEITTSFLGLVGSTSPLPLYIAEEVLEEEDDEGARRSFLDVFHHRAIALLYRLCKRYRLGSVVTPQGDDVWSQRLRALGGVDGDPGPAMDPAAWVRLLPLLLQGRRSARSLRAALRHLLRQHLGDVEVQVQELAGRWTDVDAEQRMRLGVRNSRLGEDALAGAQVRDPAGRVVVWIGPVDEHDYHRLERGGDLHALVQHVAGCFVPDASDVDLEVCLAERSAGFRLGEGALGRNSWLAATDKPGGERRVRFGARHGRAA